MSSNYWVCIVGPIDSDELPDGADGPLRTAVLNRVREMTSDAVGCWSGWGCDEQTKEEILTVWSKQKGELR